MSSRVELLPFIGRLAELQQLDEWIRGETATGILHGSRGVGKTALARRFLTELVRVKRFAEEDVFWFDFEMDTEQSAAHVAIGPGISRIGPEFLLESVSDQIEILGQRLRERASIIVWDAFELVHGMPSAELPSTFSSPDQQHLHRLLQLLEGGMTKVLITSRSDEVWLGEYSCFRLELSGMDDCERWNYLQSTLTAAQLQIDLDDPSLLRLLELTDGHPVTTGVMLGQLRYHSAAEVCSAFEAMFASRHSAQTEDKQRSIVTSDYIGPLLDRATQHLLPMLAIHRNFACASDLEYMSEHQGSPLSSDAIDGGLKALAIAGLLLETVSSSVYRMSRLLTEWFQHHEVGQSDELWQRPFVTRMAHRANGWTTVASQQDEGVMLFRLYDDNFRVALESAHRWNMHREFCTLLQWLHQNAENKLELMDQVKSYVPLDGPHEHDGWAAIKYGLIAWVMKDSSSAEHGLRTAIEIGNCDGDDAIEAFALHAMGRIKYEEWHLNDAICHYGQAVTAYEANGDKLNAARVRTDFASAARWLGDFLRADQLITKSCQDLEECDDQFGLAKAYNERASLALDQRLFQVAVDSLTKSRRINDRLGNLLGSAFANLQLEWYAFETGEADLAKQYLRWAIAFLRVPGNEQQLARAYYREGFHAFSLSGLSTAERWLQAGLKITSKDDYVTARIHHMLGMVETRRRNWEVAEGHYNHAVRVFHRLHLDEVSATYHQLGELEQERSNYSAAEAWYRKSLMIDERRQDKEGLSLTYHDLGVLYQRRKEWENAKRYFEQSLALKVELGNISGVAKTYNQLGRIAAELSDFDIAEDLYLKSLAIKSSSGDDYGSAITYHGLASMFYARGDIEASIAWLRKSIEIFERLGEVRDAARANETLAELMKERSEDSSIAKHDE